MQPFYSASVGQEWQFLLASLDMYSRSHQHEAALLRVLLREQLLVNLSVADIPDVLAWRSGHCTNLGAKRASEVYRNDSFTKLRVLSRQTASSRKSNFSRLDASVPNDADGETNYRNATQSKLECVPRVPSILSCCWTHGTGYVPALHPFLLLACQLNSVSCRDMREQ